MRTEVLEDSGQIDVIYTDFKKVFDRVLQNGLSRNCNNIL